eukprot:UN23128
MSSMLSPEFKQLDMTTKQTGEARERIQSQTDALKVEAADSDSKINSLIDQINTMKLEAITSKLINTDQIVATRASTDRSNRSELPAVVCEDSEDYSDPGGVEGTSDDDESMTNYTFSERQLQDEFSNTRTKEENWSTHSNPITDVELNKEKKKRK